MLVEFLEPAQYELEDAFLDYEEQQTNLGFRFVFEVEKTIEHIRAYPMGWQKLSGKLVEH